ncbi:MULTISPECIES: DMT family transporter [Halomonadaceae]|uniref:DMT family transporter n=1 Tax=Halomonadaceae TaxID=28256 RepID=UPI001582BF02|nr:MULTISPECIES: DMT family transporter [Halomonas]MDI4638194.1 DMT family transporter [Halomonas sp. BMC7]NUJ59194.1 DMT family transporter [Halomonas taeanensis]
MILTLVFPLLLLGGAVLAAQSSINGRLGAKVGVLASAWLTFVIGAVVTFLLAFFFEPAHSATLFSVPKWQLTGALFGVVYMLAIVFAVPRVGTAAATVAVISGQLIMSLLVDHFGWLDNDRLPLDPSRLAAMALLAGALLLIYQSNARRERQTASA